MVKVCGYDDKRLYTRLRTLNQLTDFDQGPGVAASYVSLKDDDERGKRM